ncbi:hypothetical protein AG1IA_09239 [Rhizoctonia solani AG-1 IA]|uniref:Uncharacterized protein n=1 Tax=Thanatephorus cucumeris (strain AG1-IA) TaxID=983506 RepID=L8WEX3_THACA|nr:hypothetical protein AG1IA_09239 [Rhizoctonia solani AG-1 IA]
MASLPHGFDKRRVRSANRDPESQLKIESLIHAGGILGHVGDMICGNQVLPERYRLTICSPTKSKSIPVSEEPQISTSCTSRATYPIR